MSTRVVERPKETNRRNLREELITYLVRPCGVKVVCGTYLNVFDNFLCIIPAVRQDSKEWKQDNAPSLLPQSGSWEPSGV